ncbi:RecX family transcriptional regulator [Patescibacteria group bacterium]|nr:RecX family transcriptional regulator [Patescibacteria group bacterium]
MPTITSIKPQKNKKRVNIYLDDKFGFGLDLKNFMTLGLKVEQELSDIEITEILKKAEFQKTLDKLLRFVTLRPRSEKEINNWLRKYKVHQSLVKGLFDKLKRLELLDDTKFAKWWVEQRVNFRPRAKRILSQELRMKGIDRNTIEDVLSEIKIDEGKIAKGLLEKKKYRWEKLPKIEARKKMSEFLGRKGFDWNTISKVANDLLEKK